MGEKSAVGFCCIGKILKNLKNTIDKLDLEVYNPIMRNNSVLCPIFTILGNFQGKKRGESAEKTYRKIGFTF